MQGFLSARARAHARRRRNTHALRSQEIGQFFSHVEWCTLVSSATAAARLPDGSDDPADNARTSQNWRAPVEVADPPEGLQRHLRASLDPDR